MDDVITLVSYTRTQDSVGIWREGVPSKREVFCKVNSITRQEFYQAGRDGLNPEYEFVIAAIDYGGERECIFHDKTYAIYRTYRTDDDYMELYAERKGGTNGKGIDSNST